LTRLSPLSCWGRGISPLNPETSAMPNDSDEDDRRPARRDRYEGDDHDDADDPRPGRRPPPRRKGGDGFATIVPYKNGPALAAYYCGVFGLIPVIGFLLGPIALILGIIGLVHKKKNPKVHGTGHAIAGIVLGLIDPVLWPVLWVLVFDGLTK